MKEFKVLAINPGSTSTKIAVFEGEREIFKKNVDHDAEKLKEFATINDQFDYRVETIMDALREHNVSIDECDAFVGRGGSLNSCEGGTYAVNDAMLGFIKTSKVRHPAALGCQIAYSFASKKGVPAYIVNPPDIDELTDKARVTGLKGIYRESRVHALNQKETAIRVAKDLGGKYEDFNFVVAHLGGGVSVSAHCKGKIVDTTDIINGDGPMTPTRAGALPSITVMDMCFSGKWTRDEMYTLLNKNGGFVDHIDSSDMRYVEDKYAEGDPYITLIYDGFIYQVGKYIGYMAAALSGKVDAIILTGGMAYDKRFLVPQLKDMVSFIAPIEIRAGEFEMEALASGAIRVLSGEEEAKTYTGIPVFSGFNLG